VTAAIPVVVVSASAMADSVAAATAAGAVDYLAKPLRLETLLATLDRCLPAAQLP
jgi:CheY-like chemotaxis protein